MIRAICYVDQSNCMLNLEEEASVLRTVSRSGH